MQRENPLNSSCEPLCGLQNPWALTRPSGPRGPADAERLGSVPGPAGGEEQWSASYFQKELLYPDLYIEKNEMCKVMQSQPKHSSSFALIETRIFFCMPFHKQGSYAMYIIFCPGGLLTFYDPFLIKVDQPENLFSLEVFFLYISNLCQPQKVLNNYILTEQRCSGSQQRRRKAVRDRFALQGGTGDFP